jgi:neutral ceramidase
MLKAGFARRKITPTPGIPLAGVGGPLRHGEKGQKDLFVNAVVLHDGQHQLVLLSFDLMYVSRPLCRRLEDWLQKHHNLSAPALLCTATHTHGAPLSLDVYFDQPTVDDTYLDNVASEAEEAMAQAFSQQHAAKLQFGSAECELSINRRRIILDRSALRKARIAKKLVNRPNADGPNDNQLSALILRRSASNGGDIYILSIGCHPSIIRDNQISPDFPGYIEDAMAELGADSRIVFLQGFSGNTRAHLIEKSPFSLASPGKAFDFLFDRVKFRKDSNESDVIAISRKIADATHKIRLKEVKRPSFQATKSTVFLPLEPLADRRDFDRQANDDTLSLPQRRYAKYVGENYDKLSTIDFTISCWRISDEVSLLGFEGEMFVEYGHWLRHECASNNCMAVPVSCAHGMRGYFPTANALPEGGYEVDRSRPLFGIPSRYAPKLEPTIKAAVSKLLTPTH